MSQPMPRSIGTQKFPECFLYGSGFSEESNIIESIIDNQRKHLKNSFLWLQEDVEAIFYDLKCQWEAETEYLSSIIEISMHPSYQKIIGLGDKALPFIFEDLENNLNHWFWALKSITGADPVPKNQRGKMKQMQKAWLHWWKINKYKYLSR